MTPCQPGWRAVFQDQTVSVGVRGEPIACWVLVSHGEDVHVHPFVAMGTVLEDATLAIEYICVAAPDDDIVKLAHGVLQATKAATAAQTEPEAVAPRRAAKKAK